MPLNLKSVANGSVILNPASTATDKTITLPATDGTMLVQDGTNTTTITNLAYTGTLTGGTGVINIGSGQVYKDASGNVGIGTISPPVKFSVVTAASTFAASFQGSASTNIVAIGTTSLGASINGYTAGFAAAADLVLQPNGGNLGLGVTPTSGWSASFKVMQISSQSAFWSGGAGTFISTNNYNDGGNKYIGTGNATRYYQSSGQHIWENAPSGTAGNAITFTQAMTLGSNGQWILGRSFAVGNEVASIHFNSSGAVINQAVNIVDANASASNANYIVFRKSTEASIGAITRNGTSDAVLYNTSSDYRLKNITGELTGSGSFIDALKPKVGTWKSDGSPFVGFLAHEFAEVSPSSVSGAKDAVDAKGNPEYQAMQASSSEVMANIIAELQSLRKRVAELEAA